MFLDAQAFQYGVEIRTSWIFFICGGTEMTLASCLNFNYHYFFRCQGDAGVQCLPIGKQKHYYDKHNYYNYDTSNYFCIRLLLKLELFSPPTSNFCRQIIVIIIDTEDSS